MSKIDKIIMTIDLDAFFASCEILRHPNLISKPVAIGYDLNNRGVCCAANYIAREFSIFAGTPIFKARKLNPDVIIIKPDYDYYAKKSEEVFSIIKKIIPYFEPASIDECYVDVTDMVKSTKEAVFLAKKIQVMIKSMTGLSVSIGIATRKIISKIASGLDKPNGLTTIWPDQYEKKLWKLPIKKLYGIGTSTASKFIENNVLTIGDLAKLSVNDDIYETLKQEIGVRLQGFILSANGHTVDEISDGYHELKSLGNSVTLPNDVTNLEEASAVLAKLCERVAKRANYRNCIGKTISITIRNVSGTKQSFNAQKELKYPTNNYEDILSVSLNLLEKKWDENEPIKKLGVSLGHLQDRFYSFTQMTIDNFDSVKLKNESESKEIIKNINYILGYKALSNAEDRLKYKRYVDKTINQSDRIKFKRWGDNNSEII